MFRQIIGSRIFAQNVQTRLRYLQEFVCLRESLNDSAAQQAANKLQNLAQKYNVKQQDLIEASKTIQLSKLDQSHNFYNVIDYSEHLSDIGYQFQSSPNSSLAKDVKSAGQVLQFKYPELNQPLSDARTQAYKDLEAIFLEDTEVANFKSLDFGQSQTVKFQERIQEFLEQLKREGVAPQQLSDIKNNFSNILLQYQNNPGKYFGLIKSFVESQVGVAQSQQRDVQTWENQNWVERLAQQFDKEDQEYAKNVDEAEFRMLTEEIAQAQRAESKAQYTSDENGQRVIYQSGSYNYHVLRYQVLAGALGLLSLYLFLRGDATYFTMLTVPAAAYCAFLLMKQNQARRTIPIVRQILQNSDRSYQVSIETNRVISRLENVNSVRLMNEASQFTLPFGSATSDGYFVKIDGNEAVLPYNYIGNNLELTKLVGAKI